MARYLVKAAYSTTVILMRLTVYMSKVDDRVTCDASSVLSESHFGKLRRASSSSTIMSISAVLIFVSPGLFSFTSIAMTGRISGCLSSMLALASLAACRCHAGLVFCIVRTPCHKVIEWRGWVSIPRGGTGCPCSRPAVISAPVCPDLRGCDISFQHLCFAGYQPFSSSNI
jgi:hypothetical protein